MAKTGKESPSKSPFWEVWRGNSLRITIRMSSIPLPSQGSWRGPGVGSEAFTFRSPPLGEAGGGLFLVLLSPPNINALAGRLISEFQTLQRVPSIISLRIHSIHCNILLFSPLGHPRFQVFPLMRSHSSRCSSLIPKITLLDKDDFGET